MADVNVSIALAGITEIEKSLAGLKTQFDGLGTTGKTASASLNEMGTSLATTGAKVSLLTAPLALFGKGLVTSAADYEAAMNKLEVVTGSTGDSMQAVADKAKAVGDSTVFSAGEAVTAFTNLAKNGVTLDESLGGVLDATVNLAAATGTELGTAADIAATAMQQFKVGAEDLPGMMDALFNATQSSTFEFNDFAQGLAQGGPAAATAGIEFNEFATIMATVASNFGSGSDAGTSLKTMLISLADPTKKQAELAEELGINVRDASGNFLPMRDIVGQLEVAFNGMGTAEKEQAAASLVGQDAFRALIGLADQGVKVWDENTAAVNRSGTAAAASKVMMEGFWGAVDSLTGAIQGVGIALLEAGVIDWLTNVVKWMGDAIKVISEADPMWVKLGAVIAGVTVAAGPVLIVLGGISMALSALLTPIGLVVSAVVGIGTAFVALLAYSDDLQTFFLNVAAYAKELWTSWDGSFKGLVALIGTALADIGTALFEAIKLWGPGALESVGYVVGQIIAGFANLTFELAKLGATAIQSLWQSFKDTTAGMSWTEVAAFIITAIANGLLDIARVAIEVGKSLVTGIASGIKDNIGTGLKDALDSVYNFFRGVPKEVGKRVAPVTSEIAKPFAAAPAAIVPISAEILSPFAKWPTDIGKAVAPVEKAIVDPFQKAANAVYLHSIVPEMVDGVINLFSTMEDEVGKISEMMANEVEKEINAILDDTTLTMEEQAKALARLGPKYQSMGDYGSRAMDELEPKVQDLNKEVAKNEDVLGGVKTALAQNVNAWGGWGESAGRIVEGFSAAAESSLSQFFMTGEFQLEEFGLALKQTLADEAAKTIVSFASNAAKQFLGLGTTMQTSMAQGAAGVDQAGAAATATGASMNWMGIAVLGVMGGFLLLNALGIDVGKMFDWIGSIVKGLGGLLLDVLLVPINLLIAGFSALVDLLAVFVKWIGTIGDALGAGDLKDLFKIFEGFNPLKGIGDFFGGLFGGLFHEGGLIPGKGDIAIRAEGGEFVMSKAATEMFGPLLKAMNDRGLGKSMNVAVVHAGDVAKADPFKAFASGGDMMLTRPTLLLGGESGPEMVSFRHGRSGNDAPIINNGILVADRLTLNQLGKKLYRNAQRDQLRTRKR